MHVKAAPSLLLTMPRSKKVSTENTNKVSPSNYLERLENEIQSNQSKVSLVLGILIVLVLGILVFNYFNRNKASLGPAQQTETNQQTQATQDVTQDKLPGPYTIKEEDTLFKIAEKYYGDGSKFENIAQANNLADPNDIVAGQVLQIPKLETQQTETQQTPATPEPSITPQPIATEQSLGTGTGGGDSTTWGPKIEGNTYTVVEGDWLSKIAGRAYGDIYAYEKIAQANNITDPNHIEPGMVLTIPR